MCFENTSELSQKSFALFTHELELGDSDCIPHAQQTQRPAPLKTRKGHLVTQSRAAEGNDRGDPALGNEIAELVEKALRETVGNFVETVAQEKKTVRN